MNALARLLSAPRAAALAAVFLAATAHAAPGELDTSFGTKGIRDLPGPSESSAARATALAVQPDGQIVVGVKDGDSSGGLSGLRRLDDKGNWDTGFGYNSWATRGEHTDFRALAIQPDGGILANPVASSGFTLDRDTSAGLADPAFGTNGRVTDSSFSWEPVRTAAFALQPDGKVLITGMPKTGNFLIARYHADGMPDMDFSTDGTTTTDLGAYAIALQADGKIVVAGTSYNADNYNYDFALARYRADGTPDLNFGAGGKTTTDLGGSGAAYGIALQPDGRIVVAGASGGDVALARYDADGTLDTSFGEDNGGSKKGWVVTDFGGYDTTYALALQPDGKPLVAVNNEQGDFILARYTADGALDTGFGTAGIVTTDTECDSGTDSTYRAHTLALQADGKILVAGEMKPGSGFCDFGERWVLARYQNDSFDLTPDTPASVVWANQDLGAVVESDAITVSGLGAGLSVPIAVQGGEYAVNGGAWTAYTGWVKNNDTLRVRHTTAATLATTTETRLSFGGLRAPNNSATLLGATEVKFTSTTHGAPVAQDDTATTPRGTATVIDVLANDTDPDNDPLAIGPFDSVSFQGGTVTDNGRTLTYTPPPGFTGIDTFAYTASDGRGGRDGATVTVTVQPGNATSGGGAPVAGNLTLVAYTGSTISGTLPASDADGDALSFTLVADGAKGSAVITDPATGAFTYTPHAGQTGSDSFTFKASDGAADSNTATMTVTILSKPLAGNTAPVAGSLALIAYQGSAVNGTLPASDANGDALSFTVVDSGAKGTAEITDAAAGTFTYTPAAGASGTDSFTFRVNDGTYESNTATVTVTIQPTPSSSSGGGGIDPWLLALGGLLLARGRRNGGRRG